MHSSGEKYENVLNVYFQLKVVGLNKTFIVILHLECKVNFVFVHQHNIESIFDPKIFFFHLTYFWVVNDRARNFKTFFKEYLKRNIICFNGFNFPQKMQFSERYIFESFDQF